MGNMLLRSILKNKVSYYPNISFIPTNPNSDNARNWLTEAIGINFKQKLYYEKAVNGSTPLYNGSISAQQFGANAEKEEKYYYDKLNRITNYTNTNNNTETIEYADKLGNIKKITRTGESTATIAFAYNGNRISQANNKNYLYNVNGSVLNNGEINISNYNELNLPNRISKANTTMYFTYTADGKKIFKNIDNKEVRFYDDGIEFIKARLDSPNVKLEIINTDDGKIQVKGTKYYYQYFLKDHLGNVRAIVSDNNRAVIQRADYYAFGKVRLQGDTAIKYLYNGNEYQAGLDVYDFNARTYDPVTGRFLQVDPNVEDGEQQGFNPYHFSYNNPINKSDPSGRLPDDWVQSKDGKIYWDNNATSQATTKAGETYLGKNVLVGTHNRDKNLNEKINSAKFEFYSENKKDGPIATTHGNTVPADVTKYGTLKEGLYPARIGHRSKYPNEKAILINGGNEVPTVNGNPNDPKGKPLDKQTLTGVFFHAGNTYRERLTTSKGDPISMGCQTCINGPTGEKEFKDFMKNIPSNFKGVYLLTGKN